MYGLLARTQLAASTNLEHAFFGLKPISLQEAQRAALMDRGEAKYLLDVPLVLEMLTELKNHYQILEIENCGLMAYNSIYYDTKNFSLYKDHHNGKPRRHKLRYRQYLQTHNTFLEIKIRSSSGETRKERVAVRDATPEVFDDQHDFVVTQLPNETRVLEPKLEVYVKRVTLVGIHSPERLTFDFNLRYKRADGLLSSSFEHAVIAELKFDAEVEPSIFKTIARQHGLRQTGFSKYCVGCGLMYPELKHNSFKSQMLAIRKVEDYGQFSA